MAKAVFEAVFDFAEAGSGSVEAVNFVAFNEELLKGLGAGVERVWRSSSIGVVMRWSP
jgi:hypothetical protein